MLSSFDPKDVPSQNTKVWLEDVPERFGLDIPRIIRDSFEAAWIKDGDLLPGARRDKYPFDRRAFIETSLYNVAARYGRQGMRAVERKNEGKNCSHIEITCGRLVIIPAAVESTGDLVRRAVCRHHLAKDPQKAFTGKGFEDDTPAIDSGALLAVILYGPRSAYPHNKAEATPGFVVVRFPVRGFNLYGDGRLNLLQRLVDHERAQQKPKADAPMIKPQAEEEEA